MVELTERLPDQQHPCAARLVLPYELRRRSRLHTQLTCGEAAMLDLPRGTVLHHGDRLRARDGRVIAVEAAAEAVSTAHAISPILLARACYHLGNRHVPVQIATAWLRYPRDHVLDALIASLGLSITHEDAPFEPEAGAYRHVHE